jgi:hypothetical protein
MTYPFPIMIVPARRREAMTPQEENAYYEEHAEALPGWIMAILSAFQRLGGAVARRKSRAASKACDHRGDVALPGCR